MKLPSVQDAGDLRGKRVLLRVDLNLPVVGGQIQNEYRLERLLPTFKFLKERGAKTIIVSHTDSKETDSLRLVAERLNQFVPLRFVPMIEELPVVARSMQPGDAVFLENVRKNAGEIANGEEFTKTLASFGDVYVNDAFAVSQRKHASIVGIPRFLPSYAGPLFMEEVAHLSKAFTPERPFLFILGGATKQLTRGQSRTETKFPLVKKFLEIADTVYLCGALANDVYTARGYEVGVSLVSETLPEASLLEDPKLQVPSDVIVRTAGGSTEKGSSVVEKGEKIVDAGSDALADLRALIEKARFVLWNGPLGEYEAGFDAGTIALAQELSECDAETIIGGGDSLAVISKLGLLERFSFVSTGGGAMLQFLAEGTLPGIEALLRGKHEVRSTKSETKSKS